MEKHVYIVWRKTGQSKEQFNLKLRTELAPALQAQGAAGVQLNLMDQHVEPASGLRRGTFQAEQDGYISFWLPSRHARHPLEGSLKESCSRIAGYIVCESEAIVNTQHRVAAGERTPALSQLVCIQRPPRLTYEAWLDYWLNTHTKVGIETQSNFQYTQNIVVQSLHFDAPALDAIVEECFPEEAMTSLHVFYDAVGDDEKMQKNLGIMMDSCSKFLDMDRIDVCPTSQYKF